MVYGVGFGPTNPAVSAGEPFTGAAPTTNPVMVTIGGKPAAVSFSGIVAAGLYQINVTVPPVPSGDQPSRRASRGERTLGDRYSAVNQTSSRGRAYAGTTHQNKTMHLRPGNYNIEIRENGQTPFAQSVYVTAGNTVKLHPEL